jgi:hypothetical protein
MITKPKVQKIRVRKWLEVVPGGMPTTNTLDKLEEAIAAEMLNAAGLASDDEPLLANYRSISEWCLLSTRRLVWLNQGLLSSLPWADITLAQQPPEKAAQIIRGELSKDNISELEIFDSAGSKHVVRIEAGEPYYIIWSAILAFSNLSRKPDLIPL